MRVTPPRVPIGRVFGEISAEGVGERLHLLVLLILADVRRLKVNQLCQRPSKTETENFISLG